jgi:hypothetical protein
MAIATKVLEERSVPHPARATNDDFVRNAKATRASISFPDTEAQHIRLTYLDHHAQQAGNFPNTFAFTTEVEAYRVK